ncbi:MAG TPA: hypothetical protein VFX39_04800, partial [Gemmatimonadaceae bacterium]|nr:hypothetical protein [Gemmatimonadaceae bacterium]
MTRVASATVAVVVPSCTFSPFLLLSMDKRFFLALVLTAAVVLGVPFLIPGARQPAAVTGVTADSLAADSLAATRQTATGAPAAVGTARTDTGIATGAPRDSLGAAAPAAGAPAATLGQALRSRAFLVLALTYFACCATHSGPIFHTVSYARACGLPTLAAVSIYSMEGLAGLGGRLLFGFA